MLVAIVLVGSERVGTNMLVLEESVPIVLVARLGTNSVGTKRFGTNSVGTERVGTNRVGTNSVGTKRVGKECKELLN